MQYTLKPVAAFVLLSLPMLVAAQNQSSPTLGNVVISAGGFEQEIKEAPASITVITQEDLKEKQVTSLADALRSIEGVNTAPLDARDGKTGNQSISLRGLPREYTLILIDGVRQNPLGTVTPNSFNDSQSVFIPPVAAIERIEVIRGPMSTLYGSDALGGVVNIITKKGNKEWGGSASIGRTFQGDSDFGDKTLAEAYVSGPLAGDNLGLQLYGRVFDREQSNIRIPGVEFPRPITADTPTMGQNPVAAENYTVGGKLFGKLNANNDLSLTFNSTRQEFDNTNGDVGALNRTGNPAGSACNTTAAPNFCRGYAQQLEFNRDQFTLGHVARFNAGTLETKFTQDNLETRGRTIPLNSGLDPAVEGSPRVLELDTQILDTKYITGFGAHVLTVGGQYLNVELEDGLFGGGTADGKQYSVFAEDQWGLTDKFTLTSGLRYDKNDAYAGEFTPRVYGVYQASNVWTFKGGVGRGFRTPLVEQLSSGIIGFGNQGSTPIFGNPNLKPETSTNVEASVVYSPTNAWTAQATVFQNQLKDLIEAGTGANSGQSLNVGEAVIQGLELSSVYKITRQLTLSGNYTFIDSEVTETQLDTGDPAQNIASRKGDPLTSVPDHMLNAKLNWDMNDKLSGFLSADYRSSAFRPRNFHEPQNGGNAQGQVDVGARDSNAVLGDFKGYTTVDLGLTYQLTSTVTLQGVLYNLLDQDFNNYVEYNRCSNGGCTNAVGSATGFSNQYNSIFEPRRLWLSMNVEF